jgi:hypothetical protein
MLCQLCPDCIWNNGSTEKSVSSCDDRSKSCRYVSKADLVSRMQAEKHEWALSHPALKPMERREAFTRVMRTLIKDLSYRDFEKLLNRL